ncbi:tumor necrosis factor receptor superfamily member 18 isoform X2 [Heliangelus exortis]|uniref:tumor necrosis factor receptor superfamily member 18 isoform X2 n=1 Tax=Heliangelus exortis TaxID=472823 RepID=UPI003A92A25B
MTEQRGEVGHLRTGASLLLVLCLWQWTQQTLATPCQGGELRVIGNGEKKCCPKCSSNTGDNSICQNTEDQDCRCHQGYSCIDHLCLSCQKLPECAEGEQLVKQGILDFTFECKPCETGTYSDMKNGWCQNWTDCESSGFLTVQQGNSTHNAVCGFLPKDVEQDLERDFPGLLGAPQLSHHREETCSCQFPEEEHGDKTPEEKPCYFHPQ